MGSGSSPMHGRGRLLHSSLSLPRKCAEYFLRSSITSGQKQEAFPLHVSTPLSKLRILSSSFTLDLFSHSILRGTHAEDRQNGALYATHSSSKEHELRILQIQCSIGSQLWEASPLVPLASPLPAIPSRVLCFILLRFPTEPLRGKIRLCVAYLSLNPARI